VVVRVPMLAHLTSNQSVVLHFAVESKNAVTIPKINNDRKSCDQPFLISKRCIKE